MSGADMGRIGLELFAWAATAWVHGLVLFVLVWTAQAVGFLKAPGLAQTAWRAVLLAPLLSAALQVFALGGSPFAMDLASPAQAPVSQAAAAPMAEVARAPETARPVPFDAADLLPYLPSALGWTWAGLAGLLLLRIGAQRLGLALYRRRLSPVSERTTLEAAENTARRSGLAGLSLYEDPDLAGPIAIAPDAVVLPSWTLALSAPQRAALLAHEAWHLKRRDPQVRAGLSVLAGLSLPHGYLALSCLDDLAEQACDAFAAHQAGDGQPLAECLAACLERGLARSTPSGVAAMARRHSPVVERVRRLLEEPPMKPKTQPWPQHALAVALLAGAALAAPGFAVSQAAVRAVGAPAPVVAAQASAAAVIAEAEADAVAVANAEADVDGAPALADAAEPALAFEGAEPAESGEPVEVSEYGEWADAPEPGEPAWDSYAPAPPAPPSAPMPQLAPLARLAPPPAPPSPPARVGPMPRLAPLGRLAPPPAPPAPVIAPAPAAAARPAAPPAPPRVAAVPTPPAPPAPPARFTSRASPERGQLTPPPQCGRRCG